MKYFGVPRCPYCKKRVGFLRTWKLKREGEYRCPRCSGISNIYLSPLIYVFALIAVFAGGMLYFFHKFILDDIEPTTAVEVFLPFAIFFLVSLFLVYLEKPALKKVTKKGEKNKNKDLRTDRRQMNTGRTYGSQGTSENLFRDDDYIPNEGGQTGPVYRNNSDYYESSSQEGYEYQEPYTENLTQDYTGEYSEGYSEEYNQSYNDEYQEGYDEGYGYEPQQQYIEPEAIPPAPVVSPVEPQLKTQINRQVVSSSQPVGNANRPNKVNPVEISGDFFSKYDDPEYIEKRMNEINGTGK